MHLKIPKKFRDGRQHGLFLLMALGLVIGLGVGVGSFFKEPSTPPNAPGVATNSGLPAAPPGSFVLKPEAEAEPGERKVLSLTGPALWQGGDKGDQTRMARIDSQYFYAATRTKTPIPERFEVDLYRFSERPGTHLHVRQVDYNELGYGGGLKIAFELVEEF